MNDMVILPVKYKGLEDFIANLRNLNPNSDRIVANIQFNELIEELSKEFNNEVLIGEDE